MAEHPDVTDVRGRVDVVTFLPALDRKTGVLDLDRERNACRSADEDVRGLTAVLAVVVE